jgi:hypothetical protein
MVLLRGYFDDSIGAGGDAYLALEGYLAPIPTWQAFETRWQNALDKAGLPWLHMREFGSRSGVYAKWYGGKHDDEKIAFFHSLIGVVRELKLSPMGATVRMDDVGRFNCEFGLHLDAYSLALQFCLIELTLMYPDSTLEIILDRVPKGPTKIALAKQYIGSDKYYPDARKIVDGWKITPLDKKLTFRNVLPIQAADFLAWETRKSITRRDEWFTTVKPELQPAEEWLMSLLMWEGRKKGNALIWPDANERRSFVELKRERPIEGQVWDYHALCGVHKARGGSWA